MTFMCMPILALAILVAGFSFLDKISNLFSNRTEIEAETSGLQDDMVNEKGDKAVVGEDIMVALGEFEAQTVIIDLLQAKYSTDRPEHGTMFGLLEIMKKNLLETKSVLEKISAKPVNIRILSIKYSNAFQQLETILEDYYFDLVNPNSNWKDKETKIKEVEDAVTSLNEYVHDNLANINDGAYFDKKIAVDILKNVGNDFDAQ